jgi:hypothetical protein
MTSQRLVLLQARKKYSECARLLEARIAANGLSKTLSEQIIGVGIAADWVRRSAEMEDIRYLGDHLNNSPRKASFVELLRFGFSWFALNAIFSRRSLLQIVGNPAGSSEYEDFLVLFNAATMPSATSDLAALQALLSTSSSPRLPGVPAGTSVPTLTALHEKYLSIGPPRGKTAKAIAAAAKAGQASTLDLPTLLYSFRNWSVHGNALDGSFGSRPGFQKYVALLHETLAHVHLNTGTVISSKL